jgi:hypothetical protein
MGADLAQARRKSRQLQKSSLCLGAHSGKAKCKTEKGGSRNRRENILKKHSLLIPGKELGACLDAYFAGLAGFRHGQSMSQASRYSCSPCAEKATHRVATFSRIRQGFKIAESRF